eukprot:TRINITY_DN23418_c0_g1_i1.p4 TRINITY_DN23418_c0_g1~~TRINITY_DN23418_c0_g1_i1.p4  ORF type:complete len:101 (-),score=6.71 TRINITY_DN23418_c0_g1_i1:115-417(-)
MLIQNAEQSCATTQKKAVTQESSVLTIQAANCQTCQLTSQEQMTYYLALQPKECSKINSAEPETVLLTNQEIHASKKSTSTHQDIGKQPCYTTSPKTSQQ